MPQGFDFFQAVRLLQRAPGARPDVVGAASRSAVETVRFHTVQSLSFPAAPLLAAERRSASKDAPERYHLQVSFLGLTGPSGVLPDHYTDLVQRRLRVKDAALRDFLDLFNHRLVSLFYRAWAKYRPVPAWESGQRSGAKRDPFGELLYALAGLAITPLRGRQTLDDRVLVRYAGHLSRRPPCAVALKAMLEDWLRVPVRLEQFALRWLTLARDEQSRLSAPLQGRNRYNRLGRDAVLGERVIDAQSHFRVHLGPLSYAQFRRLSPLGDLLGPTSELINTFAGPQLSFDLQPVVQGDDVPRARLTGATPPQTESTRLGWNSWLGPRPDGSNADDAVFAATIK
jgi:type VI secretion system protein ImpH